MNLDSFDVLVLGGTGTLGSALVRKITDTYSRCRITVLSRDEHKQAAMKKKYPSVKFKLGDITRDDIDMSPYQIVFHVAALKHVDILEENCWQSYLTNVVGTQRMIKQAQEHGVGHYIFSSTDKAIDPINAYGYSKAMAEKLIFSTIKDDPKGVNFSVFRWGNVVGSQGSAIPQFIKTLREERRVYVTDLQMTRFWITIDQAVDFMLQRFDDADPSYCARIPPDMKAAPVLAIIDALSQLVGIPDYSIVVTGMRPGEKIHEAMRSRHIGAPFESDTFHQYSHSELVEMLKPFCEG